MGVHRDRVRGGHHDPISPQRPISWSSGHSRDSAGADSDRKPEPAKGYEVDPHTGKRMQALAEAAGAGAFIGMVIVFCRCGQWRRGRASVRDWRPARRALWHQRR